MFWMISIYRLMMLNINSSRINKNSNSSRINKNSNSSGSRMNNRINKVLCNSVVMIFRSFKILSSNKGRNRIVNSSNSNSRMSKNSSRIMNSNNEIVNNMNRMIDR